jgi:hypothetical protein
MRAWRRVQVISAAQTVDKSLSLSYVFAQCGCFQPYRACPAVRGGDALAFNPFQLGSHLVQLTAQRTDQLHGLGALAIIHRAMVAFTAPSRDPFDESRTAENPLVYGPHHAGQ